ncbi:glycosyltransferase [Salmonella enterica]|nr:glycosyltransferase [Salmonella enterica]EDF4587396.1 glycosyltransferase [Salmonella enterica]EHA3427938.1 glycosyltransferase [Salmonella enterica]EIF9323451.1 glycosyltransferase [Salmonella enterica]
MHSILSQSYPSIELIIIANNCTNDFFDALKKRECETIKVLRTNIAYLPYCLNKGLDLCNGDFVARMDSDDISHPERIDRQVDFLINNPDIDVVGTNAVYIDEDDVELEKSNLPENNNAIKKMLPYKCCLVHPSVMFRKNVVISSGGYMFANYSEDYELWNRLAVEGRTFYNLSEYLLYYRLHNNQSTSKNNLFMVMVNDVAIKVKYFLLTKKVSYLLGIIRTVFSVFYCKYIK